jgi:preprotein translocase subunit SecA
MQVAKQIFLTVLDGEWKDHLLSLDKLRQGINLRAYAQKDPFIEYKKEAFSLYEDMMLRIEENVIAHLSHVQITQSENSSNPEVNQDKPLVKKIKKKK